MSHSYDLERFVDAQNANGTYDRAVDELRRGRKTSHWMWFVFPQIAGLGASAMSRRYAIRSVEEARAYLADPVLGARYRVCVAALETLAGLSAKDVFGAVDATKLRSSLTLFAAAAPGEPLFEAALARWFEGAPDSRTLELLARGAPDGNIAAPRSSKPLRGAPS